MSRWYFKHVTTLATSSESHHREGPEVHACEMCDMSHMTCRHKHPPLSPSSSRTHKFKPCPHYVSTVLSSVVLVVLKVPHFIVTSTILFHSSAQSEHITLWMPRSLDLVMEAIGTASV